MQDDQFAGVVKRWIRIAQLPMPRNLVTGQDADERRGVRREGRGDPAGERRPPGRAADSRDPRPAAAADRGLMRLEGARVIVTGASRGIGRAVAEAVAAEGGRLVVTATRRENLEGLLARLRERGAEAHGVALDLADPGSVRAAASEAVAALGRVEGLVNNAEPPRRPPPARRLPDGRLGARDGGQRHGHAPAHPGACCRRCRGAGRSSTSPRAPRAAPPGGPTASPSSRSTASPGCCATSSRTARSAASESTRAAPAPRCAPPRTRTRIPPPCRTPRAGSAPFIAILAGEDPGPHVEAAQWTGG